MTTEEKKDLIIELNLMRNRGCKLELEMLYSIDPNYLITFLEQGLLSYDVI